VQPAAEAARGGTLVTGTGGDQVLEPSRYEHAPRAGAPRPRDLARWGFRLAPQGIRRAVMARREPEPLALPWLREGARRDAYRGLHDDAAAEPRLAAQRTRWVWRLRAIQVALRSLAAVVEDEGATLVDPMLDRGFVAALAAAAPDGGYSTRTEAMRSLAGDLLPDDVCARSTKAVFQRPFWNQHAEAFAKAFDGTGVDPALVDADALKRHWSDPEGPTAQSMTVLQAAWLAGDAGSAAAQRSSEGVGHSGG
jgi:asparagine synthase (glutamine-hydrolysing)